MGRTRSSSPTISEVAAAAGVGRATAARTLGGYGYVSDEMRERVLASAEALGYRANQLARSVSTGVSHTIGVVVADISNPFFGGVVRGVSEIASARGFDALVISTYEHLEDEIAAMNVLVDKRVDGIILSSAACDPASTAHLQLARERGIPLVLLDRLIPGIELDAVVIDNRTAARTATGELIAAGHARIGFVWGPPTPARPSFRRDLVDAAARNLWSDGERLMGYLDALDDSGLPLDPDLVAVGEKTEAHTYDEVMRMLALADPPTAFFCTETDALTGTLHALRDSGVAIPSQASVIGFDDSSWAAVMEPPLTMVEQPMLDLGRRAAELLLGRIDGDGDGEEAPTQLELPARLIQRASVAPPR
ncbi:LacI family transcriptional regulator [Leucobacter sp. UCD-THU]|uniref:LacI family DNA-binding transcriptional regulator n=1 Tax=Leucobacter sp. UCD-THU TaxID=1292023 RepID=UPI0003662FC1|nr:LacI family DNA-binding transcriptional regulator [Leucobacter sp. UCD-THU]EYT54788.1 LacI family transcriptional regulator [Leucobacter sp. UCD-THU]